VNATKTEQGEQLTCRHCGASVAREQDWCFECGKAVTTRVVPPPSWLLPVGIILAAVAVVAVAAVTVVTQLQPDRAAQQGPIPARTAPAPTPGPAPPAPPAGTRPRAGGAPRWPGRLEAYTVVLQETRNAAAAEAGARSLVARGADAGVLRTDDYEPFTPGRWVVWRGRYQRLAKATEALGLLRAKGRRGQIRFVRPRR
jgi:hypothetical protein